MEQEPAILFNLRRRFLACQPYTYTGDICISVRDLHIWAATLATHTRHNRSCHTAFTLLYCR